MEPVVQSPILIYTEQTPNPDSLKFVTSRMLFKGTADFRTKDLAEDWSPLAVQLFGSPYVQGVYICNNFVTVTKEMNYVWEDIMLKLKEQIKTYVNNGGVIVSDGFEESMAQVEQTTGVGYEYSGDEAEIVKKIKDLIETYVKPAVEMDGGNIEFKSYHEGVVTVTMQGACSGCPSSTVTLQSGIEGMLKRMIPEITTVRSEMG